MEKGKCNSCKLKDKKQLPLNSLLHIFGYIFEKVTYNSLFSYFISNKPFNPSQSSFLPDDSCQITIITSQNTNCAWRKSNCYVRGVFLDISKAFIWRSWWTNFTFKKLWKRKQRVVLNGQTSEETEIISEVPQESVLGRLLFLIYIIWSNWWHNSIM